MRKLLNKEMKLSASPLAYLFIVFGLLALVPGYPILLGSFFCCLGLFHSFQAAREANDILYTALLPVAKRDVVKSKYIFCLFIQLCYFLLTTLVTLIRMGALSEVAVYRSNALMPANLVYLGFVLLVFGCFNAVFVGGFFKTAYNFGRPFLRFIILAFLIVGIAETLVHVPALRALGALGFEQLAVQTCALLLGAAAFAALTLFSMQRAIRNFETIDL